MIHDIVSTHYLMRRVLESIHTISFYQEVISTIFISLKIRLHLLSDGSLEDFFYWKQFNEESWEETEDVVAFCLHFIIGFDGKLLCDADL